MWSASASKRPLESSVSSPAPLPFTSAGKRGACESCPSRIRSAHMKIYDISLSLSSNTVRWVTAQPFELIERKRMRRGDGNNSSSIHTSLHAGTHVDAPFHFVPDGSTIESLPLELFIGPARVCELSEVSQITAADVNRLE